MNTHALSHPAHLKTNSAAPHLSYCPLMSTFVWAIGRALNSSPRRHPGGILIRFPNHLTWLLSKWRSSGFTPSPLLMFELLTLSLRAIPVMCMQITHTTSVIVHILTCTLLVHLNNWKAYSPGEDQSRIIPCPGKSFLRSSYFAPKLIKLTSLCSARTVLLPCSSWKYTR